MLGSADNRVRGKRCGAIEAIVSAMKTHIENAGACEAGYEALLNFIVDGKQQRQCQHWQENCLNFLLGNNKKTTVDNRAKAGECGAIEAIVNGMKVHANNVGICRAGCGALNNATFDNGKQQPQR